MIGIDMKLPHNCANCPCSYWIQSGEFEGKLMCNVMEYKAELDSIGKNYLVDELKKERPDNCPMEEIKISNSNIVLNSDEIEKCIRSEIEEKIKRKDCAVCRNTYYEYCSNGIKNYKTHCIFSKECIDSCNGKECERWNPKSIDEAYRGFTQKHYDADLW